MKWDAAQTCQHSLLKCGECRALEPKPVGPTHAELAREVDDLRAKLAALHGGINPDGEHRPEVCAKVQDNCLAPACVIERRRLTETVARPAAPPAPTGFYSGQLNPVAPTAPLKLDLGCGTRKQPGFLGVDVRKFDGVDVVCDLATSPWPWADASVEEVFCSHALEHVQRLRRPHFFNELYRVLKPGGKGTFVTPHWASCRAYGDITHEWPPISEFFWPYLDKQWRKDNAPHNDVYACDFTAGYGYTLAAWLQGRNQEFVMDALTKFKEAAQDMQATVVKR